MSNNAPDYEDNLVFPPQEVKSQDDIKRQDTRSSDVLIKTLEKCEKLEEQLSIAVEALEKYANKSSWVASNIRGYDTFCFKGAFVTDGPWFAALALERIKGAK